MSKLFISDLHLDPSRPAATAAFLAFLAGPCREARALYILGDLFEVWIGDDDDNPHHARVREALLALTSAGVPCAFIHGNRDFLIGVDFSATTGVELLAESTVIDLDGEPTLIMHGDSLCTHDTAYQRLRRFTHNQRVQSLLLALPLGLRRRIARWARQKSQAAQAGLPPAITDVSQDSVLAAMREAGVSRLIHGHTHRPAVHQFVLDGRPARRIVLGDWYEQGSVLRCANGECRLEALSFG